MACFRDTITAAVSAEESRKLSLLTTIDRHREAAPVDRVHDNVGYDGDCNQWCGIRIVCNNRIDLPARNWRRSTLAPHKEEIISRIGRVLLPIVLGRSIAAPTNKRKLKFCREILFGCSNARPSGLTVNVGT